MPPIPTSAGARFDDMIAHNGRVSAPLLAAFAVHANPIRFKDTFRHPFLVGQELYEGELRQQAGSQTLVFERAEPVIPTDGNADRHPSTASETVANAIYAIRRRQDSKRPANVVTIGRGSTNDLIIAEYAISSEHAHIIIEYGSYYLVDIGSRNGTEVNGKHLEPKQRVKLDGADVIAFGRIAFVMIPVPAMQKMLQDRAAGG